MTVSPATRLLDDPLVRGREALARGDWEQARECFAAAGETPAALDGLAWTGWWLADERLTIDARERAYRAYRAAGDDGAAARVAAWLATDHREFRGEEAVARGWLRRAQRLISGLEGETAERALRALPHVAPLQRLPALELLARARGALGEHDAAGEACAEIATVVEPIDTPYLRGRARLVAGEVAGARGDWEQARRASEDAVDCFTAGSAPYEAALARVTLATALAALGHEGRADAERTAARETFARLGARRDLERLERLESPSRARGAHGELSPRELEVLRLVAQGLSDAEIAERLVVSQHTVHRHVANVRAKLRLPSRAAAVAYAAREGLL